MFKEYSVDDDDVTGAPIASSGQFGGRLTVALLTGESVDVPYNSSMEILELKRQIMQKLNHEIGKQKLLYKNKQLTVSKRGYSHFSALFHALSSLIIDNLDY